MGSRGPAPKRSDQRRRTNEPSTPITSAEGIECVRPEPDEGWHPVARRMWDAIAGSGQACFYQASDWATAWTMCESMHREFSDVPVVTKDGEVLMVAGRPNGAVLNAWRSMQVALLLAEGDRRRVGLELTLPPPSHDEGGADVTDLTAVLTDRARSAG